MRAKANLRQRQIGCRPPLPSVVLDALPHEPVCIKLTLVELYRPSPGPSSVLGPPGASFATRMLFAVCISPSPSRSAVWRGASKDDPFLCEIARKAWSRIIHKPLRSSDYWAHGWPAVCPPVPVNMAADHCYVHALATIPTRIHHFVAAHFFQRHRSLTVMQVGTHTCVPGNDRWGGRRCSSKMMFYSISVNPLNMRHCRNRLLTTTFSSLIHCWRHL
ncbi:uncharacterized protein BJ171DRAFT_269781 [Polychytrium aggregatum]|uniref:uncharacterized protein n=1 Tax=Polychytrium aggregatum TaxID=110093 RepID=UPI0022FEFAED|nr:uncharacterized protein BJ171DRAFT_269781 [Polychytrium aggregatum]KAI9193424.1 hypothetical protein BJ171DRAFT_269781 [Polychytrium aggregatum]